jgi:F-type H+-transporting ATPase subunit b
MELFQIEPGLMIWTWISFLCLLAIMYKFVFPTLIQNIKHREDMISKSVDDAEIISKTREKIDSERADVLKRSKTEGDDILRSTRKEADLLKKNLEEQAELSAAEIIKQAQQKAKEENIVARQQLKTEIAEFVCDASEKLINRAFVKEDDQKWTRELAESL